MKRWLALVLIVSMIGCGQNKGETIFTFDDSVKASKQYTNFGGIIVWEQSQEPRPWGLENESFFRLVWEKPQSEIVFQPPSSLVINKKPVCNDIFKQIYAIGDKNALYLNFANNNYWLMLFDGKSTRKAFLQPLNAKVVHTSDMTKPSCRIVWDEWNKKYILTAAIGNDTTVFRYKLDPFSGKFEKGPLSIDSFIAVPDDGFIIENTNSYELAGNLVDFIEGRLVLKSCLLRYDPVSKLSFYLSDNELYRLVKGNPVLVGKIPKLFMPGFFGVNDGEPFMLELKGTKKVSLSYFK